MPSNALTVTLAQMLADAEELDNTHALLAAATVPPQGALDAINRAVVVTCVSAWEAFVEDLVREAVATMRPAGPPLGVWSSHAAWVLGEVGRFNTPNGDNVRRLLSDTLGLPDVQQTWVWAGHTAAQSSQELARALRLRNQIAHGVNPRPQVFHQYSSQLADFFRRLGGATDQAVRDHLVNNLGVALPWPP